MLSRLASFIERFPKIVIFAIIAITLIFASFLPSLKMGTSTRDFMPNNEMVKAQDRINEYFGKNTEPVLIIIHQSVKASSIREEYELMKKLKKIDGVVDVVGLPTFVSAMCGMEYQKKIEECSNEEIMNAYHDMMDGNEKVYMEDAIDAKYGFADIIYANISINEKTLVATIKVTDEPPFLASIEWFISFKNRIDPASLNLTYMISARLSPPRWEIGRGVSWNIANMQREMASYIWIGKNGKFVDFPLNASISMEGNEIRMEISREELGKYGIAPSFGNASLPAKLYEVKAGSRVSLPSLISINSGILNFIIKIVEKSILNNLIERMLPLNMTMEDISSISKKRESFSINDIYGLWKTIDVVESQQEMLIRQPSMDELKNSVLSFLSSDRKVVLMIAHIDGNRGRDEIKKISKNVFNTVKEFYGEKGTKSEATGSGVISYQIDELTNESNKIIMPGIFLAIMVILLINFRKPSYMVISITGLSIAIIWLFGTMAIAGIKFNALAVAFVPLLLGLGVDYSVHIFHNYLNEIEKGKSVREAIAISIKEVGLALILATITTAISFLSFITASVPSVRDFGILAAVGIAYTFIIAITLEASIRYILDRKKKVVVVRKKISSFEIMKKLSDILCKNPGKVILFIVIITLFMASAAANVKTSFSLEEFMPENSEAIKAMEKLPHYFPSAGEDQEYVLIEGDVASVETLRGIKETVNKIGDDEYVARLPDGRVKADSIYALIIDALRENGSLKEKFGIGNDGLPKNDKDVKALYDYLYEKYERECSSILHKNNGKYDATLIRIYTKLTHLENSNTVMEKLYRELREDLSNYGNARATVTGDMVLIYTIMNSLTKSQFNSTLMCIFVAGIVIMLAYRKPVLALLTMLPVMISSIWILGTMYIAGYTLNVMTVMITSLTIGLGITYAIHVVERFRLVGDRTGDVLHAVEEAVANTGKAVMMAAITTIAGFSILIFSPMPPEQQFGFITAMTIIYSFLTTILLIPPLLLLWGRWRKRRKGYIISPYKPE